MSSVAKSVLVLLVNGFEEIEVVTPVDLLRRAGAEVTLASVSGESMLQGRCGITLKSDAPLDAVSHRSYDMLLIPGGPGVAALRAHPGCIDLVRRMHASGSLVAAICAAPAVLADAGLLAGRRFTIHASMHPEFPHALTGQPVVTDGDIITSRGAGTALSFGLELVGRLYGAPAAASVATQVMA